MSARLSLYIALISVTIFAVAFYLFGSFSYRLVKRDSEHLTQSMLSETILRIQETLRSVEVATANMEGMVYDRIDTPDSIYAVTRRLLENNPIISGSAVAFEPNYYPQKGRYFSPYTVRKADSLHCIQLGNEDYQYEKMDWYKTPKQQNIPYWSEPYYDAGGGEMLMTTYSRPLHDRNGRMFAVFTADISLEWLTQMVNGIRPYPNSYTLMIGRGGTYIVHPKKEHILNRTIFNDMAEMEDTTVRVIGREMIAGQHGWSPLRKGDKRSYVFYAPISSMGWSVAVICPYDDIFAELKWMRKFIIIIVLIGLLSLLFFCIRTIRHTMSPLSRFAEAAEGIAGGDFNEPLPVIKGNDEMAQLYRSFDFMQHSLVRYMDELKKAVAQRARIDSELHIAREIQMGMLPKTFPPFPERDDIDLYAQLIPAREVGGDLYDFFVQNDSLYFAIGDVSGKGVPASLLMAVTRSLFRTVGSHIEDPARIVTALNESISENNDSNMFVTLFVGILDLSTGSLRYCNAGHNPPVLSADGVSVGFLEVEPQLPVGLFLDYVYREQQMKLSPGSVLFLYTDGLTEAENGSEELFSEKRLLEELGSHLSESAREMTLSIKQAVEKYADGAEQSDDLTIMALRFCPVQSSEETQAEQLDPLPWRRQLVLENKVSGIGLLEQFIEQIASDLSLSEQLANQLNLALEEAVSNVIFYAFPKESVHEFTLDVELADNPRRLIFTLTDSGEAFDPTTVAEPDISLPSSERPIGGLGIHLIRQIMNKVEYRRENGLNILILTKYF